MRWHILSVVILSAFSISSCIRSNAFLDIKRARFENPDTLSGKICPSKELTSDDFFGAKYVIPLTDDLLLLEYPTQDFLFGIYDVRQGCLKVKFLRRGRGPGEVLDGAPASVRTLGDDVQFDVVSTHALLTYSLNGILDGNDTPIRSVDVGPLLPSVGGSIFAINENTVFCDSYGGNEGHSYKVVDVADSSILATYKIFCGRLCVSQKSLKPLRNCCRIKPDGSKVVFLMKFMDKVHILDLMGKENVSVTCTRPPRPDRRVMKIDNNLRQEYVVASVSDDYILAMALGPDMPSQGPMYIFRLFNWNGKLLRQYYFDEPIWSAAISPSGKKFFAITEDEVIYEYRLFD